MERELVAQQPVGGAELPQRRTGPFGGEQPRPGWTGLEEHDVRGAGAQCRAQRLDDVGEVRGVLDRPVHDVMQGCGAPSRGDVGPAVREHPPAEEVLRPVRPGGRHRTQAAGSAS